jgi:hypothetical protein
VLNDNLQCGTQRYGGSAAPALSNQRQRSGLLVLITLRVLYDQREARALTEDLRSQ